MTRILISDAGATKTCPMPDQNDSFGGLLPSDWRNSDRLVPFTENQAVNSRVGTSKE